MSCTVSRVAPLRVRGLKHLTSPYERGRRGRTLAGAWIETAGESAPARGTRVAPLRVRGLKRQPEPDRRHHFFVAPLRVRGLKRLPRAPDIPAPMVAPLRVRGLKRGGSARARPHTGGRTLAGAWIETRAATAAATGVSVAPLRVRGLKPRASRPTRTASPSHPCGCVD